MQWIFKKVEDPYLVQRAQVASCVAVEVLEDDGIRRPNVKSSVVLVNLAGVDGAVVSHKKSLSIQEVVPRSL